MNTSKKTLGIALAATFATAGLASAADNGFAMQPMPHGYMVAEANTQAAGAGDAQKTTTPPPPTKPVKKAKPKSKAVEKKCAGMTTAKQSKAAEANCGGKADSKVPNGKCAPGACGANMSK